MSVDDLRAGHPVIAIALAVACGAVAMVLFQRARDAWQGWREERELRRELGPILDDARAAGVAAARTGLEGLPIDAPDAIPIANAPDVFEWDHRRPCLRCARFEDDHEWRCPICSSAVPVVNSCPCGRANCRGTMMPGPCPDGHRILPRHYCPAVATKQA